MSIVAIGRKLAHHASKLICSGVRNSVPPATRCIARLDRRQLFHTTQCKFRNVADTVCWSCGTCVNHAKIFCGSCDYIQPLDGNVNFFQLLEVPQQFSIDKAKLETNFKRKQKSVHPDLFGAKSEKEQNMSADASSKLNIAYSIIKNPISRAQYLLQLYGIDAIGEAAGSSKVDMTLLMQIMEAREMLEDAGTGQQQVLELRQTTLKAMEKAIGDLDAAFKSNNLNLAADITVALQYYSKLQSEAEEWLAAREIPYTTS